MEQGNEVPKETMLDNGLKRDLKRLKQLSCVERLEFFQQHLKKDNPEHFLQLWHHLPIIEQRVVLETRTLGERFLIWAIKQGLPLIEWFLSDTAVEDEEKQSNPNYQKALWVEFQSISRCKTTDNTLQQYLVFLSKLSPGDSLLTWVLLQLSQSYLLQNLHQKAMHYAAGAFYHTWRCSSNISLSLLMQAQGQIQRVLTHYIQSYVPSSLPIYFNFFDRFLDLHQHRENLKAGLPDYPAPGNDILWKWFAENTDFFKKLTADLWGVAIKLQGTLAPCPYALLGLGSMARDEMCPYSDIEYALIISKNTSENRLFFERTAQLLELLCIALGELSLPLMVTDSLLEKKEFDPTPSGFHIDDAYNPRKPKMLGTCSELLSIQKENISLEDDLYLAQHMLRTVCYLLGDSNLSKEYEQGLKTFYLIWRGLYRRYDPTPMAKTKALFGLEADANSLVTTEINRRKGLAEAIQIKEELYCLPSQFLSHLTLYYGLDANSAKARLVLLEKNKKLKSEAARHLADLISQSLHLRAAAQLHYGYKREESYTKEKYASDDSRFFIQNNEKLHDLYCLVLSLEEILKQFVQSKGSLDLCESHFSNTSEILIAHVLIREGSFDKADELYHTLARENPNSIKTLAQQINFYYIQYQTFEHEWASYKQEGNALTKLLAKILMSQDIPSSDYVSRYHHLPQDCREAFENAVSTQICVRLKKSKDKPEQNEEIYWNNRLAQADEYINLQKKDQNLKQKYQPKVKETGLEHNTREEQLNEKRLLVYKTALQSLCRNTKFPPKKLKLQVLGNQESLVMCLFFLLKKKLQKSKEKSQKAFEKIKSCLREMIKNWQEKEFLEKDYVAVYALLTPFCRKLYREELLDYQDRLKQQKSTQNPSKISIKDLLKTLNMYPDEDGQREDWVLHKRQWEATLKALVMDAPESITRGNYPQKPSLVSPLFVIRHQHSLGSDKKITDNHATPTHLCYPLTDSTRNCLLTDVGEFQMKQISGSQSYVVAVTVSVTYYSELHKKEICERRKIYLKKDPKMVGMSYWIERLHHQSIGYGTSLSELVRLEVPGKSGIPVLISEEIEGENLDDVLKTDPHQLKQLSHFHFSELALLAMLTNPGDGKPANYIWVKLENGLYSLVSVDHDYALFPASLLEPADPNKPTENLRLVLQVRSILFCLDAMHQPIDPKAREHFCKLDPIQVLRQVLQQAQVQNTYYTALFLAEELQSLHEQHAKDPKKGCTIPIPLQEGDMVAVYQKFVQLQEFLKKKPKATLLQCLLQVEPRVGLAYQAVLAESLNPRDRFIRAVPYLLREGHMITSGSALASRRLGGVLTKTDYVQLNTFSPEQGLAELDLLAYQHRQLKLAQKEVQKGTFERFIQLLLESPRFSCQ